MIWDPQHVNLSLNQAGLLHAQNSRLCYAALHAHKFLWHTIYNIQSLINVSPAQWHLHTRFCRQLVEPLDPLQPRQMWGVGGWTQQ